MARAPVNYDPGVQKRQVTTQQTDTYYRVKGPDLPAPLQTNVQRLEAALSDGTDMIKGYLAEEKAKQDAASEVKAREYLFTHGVKEVQRQRKEGTLPFSDDPVAQTALARSEGVDHARSWAQEITDGLADGSIDPGTIQDPEAWVQQSISDRVQTLGEVGNLVHGGFTDTINRTRGQIIDKLKSAKSDIMTSNAKQSVFTEIGTMVEEGLKAGSSPEQIHAAIRGRYQDYKDVYGFTGEIIDQEVLRTAEALASQPGGNYELVQALLGERTGTGSIAGKRKYAATAAKIIETSLKAHGDKAKEDHFEAGMAADRMVKQGSFTEEVAKQHREKYPEVYKGKEGELRRMVKASNANHETLKRQRQKDAETARLHVASQVSEANRNSGLLRYWNSGRGLDLPEVTTTLTTTGKPKEYTYETNKKDMINLALQQSQRIAQENNETPQQTLAREVNEFSHSGFDHPILKRKMEAFSGMIHTIDVTGPESFAQNDQFNEILKISKYVKAVAPQYYEKMVGSSQSKEALDSIMALEKYKGVTTAEAAHIWFQATADKSAGKAKANSLSYIELDKQVAAVQDSKGDFMSQWLWQKDKTVENTGQMMGQVEKVARLYIDLGLNPTDALQQAGEDVMSKMTVINNHAVYTGDIETSSSFDVQVEDELKGFADRNSLDVADLSIQSLGSTSNNWVIVYKTTNSLAKYGVEGSVFSTADLNRNTREADATRKEEARQEIAANQKVRQERPTLDQMNRDILNLPKDL